MRFHQLLLDRVPYRAYRPVVHVVHTLRVLGALLAGPSTGRRLVVHDPATQPHRRTALAWLARSRGWTPALVYVDIDRADARRGQVARGRVVRAPLFDGHWRRGQRLRLRLLADLGTAVGGGFSSVDLVNRRGGRGRTDGAARGCQQTRGPRTQ